MIIFLLAILLLAACNGKQDRETQRDTTARPARTQTRPGYTDPQAAQILLALDSARIEGANALRGKSENESVLEFARVMIADHRAISEVLDSLLAAAGQAPTQSPLSQQLMQASAQFAWQMAQTDTGINNAYIAREVREHERALQLLDGVLIPGTRMPELQSLLEQIVPAYHAHLQQARQLLAARTTRATDLSSAARARSTSGTAGAAARPDADPRQPAARQPAARPPAARPPVTSEPKLLGRPVTPPRADTSRIPPVTTTTNM